MLPQGESPISSQNQPTENIYKVRLAQTLTIGLILAALVSLLAAAAFLLSQPGGIGRPLPPLALAALLISILIPVGLLYFFSQRVIKPFKELTQAAIHFAEGDYSQRVTVQHSDEIGLLASSFNHIADELSELNLSALDAVELQADQLRMLQAAQAGAQETSHLYKATREVIQARSEPEIVQILTEALPHLTVVGTLLSLEGDHFKIIVIADPQTGYMDISLHTMRIPAGRVPELLVENRTVIIEDLAQTAEYETLIAFLLRRGFKTAALISAVANGQLTKILALSSNEANTFTQTSLQPYANLMEAAGMALEKLQVTTTLHRRQAELQTLANFSQAISGETNIDQLYQVLHRQVIETFGAEMEFVVAIYNQADNLIEFPYSYENQQRIMLSPAKLGEGLTSTIIQSQQPLLLANSKAIQARNAIVAGRMPLSWLGIPLIFGGRTMGVIIVQDLVHENRFTQDDLNLFMTLAPQIATAVRNAQLHTEALQALQAYDQERFLLNNLLDYMPEVISFKDPHGCYIRASQSIAHVYGIQAEEMIGKTDYDLMDPDTAAKISQTEQVVMSLGKPEIGIIENSLSAAGQKIWSQISRIPIRSTSGALYGLLLIQRDVTELKQAENLAKQRAEQVYTAAEIARDTTGTLDVETLLKKSVNLVRERFGFYHASIFLVDSSGEYAVLRESTGQAGAQMLSTGHRLAVGSKSIVGQVTETGQALIVNDVTRDPTHLVNPLLPETNSELAIPLIVSERVLGALDVQSTQVDAFNSEDVGALQILADQLAVAVVNGELFTKTQALLGKHRLLRQISISASANNSLEDALTNVVEALQQAQVGERTAVLMLNQAGQLQVTTSAGYQGTRHLETLISLGQGVTGQAAASKRPVRVDDVLSDPYYINIDPDVRSELALPIMFGDELIGVLNLESVRSHAYDENDEEILGALGTNLGGIIANIRLVNQVRQQVSYERQLFEVTSKIRRSVDLETILQTSAQEIAQVLGARRASIHIDLEGLKAGSSNPDTQRIRANQPLSAHNGNGSSNGAAKPWGLNGTRQPDENNNRWEE